MASPISRTILRGVRKIMCFFGDSSSCFAHIEARMNTCTGQGVSIDLTDLPIDCTEETPCIVGRLD